MKAVADLKPDLLLLDVQMPKLDGFEVLELVGRDVAVVFVTAYDQCALKAFDVHAVDYLLKPFSQERLVEALDRAHAAGARRAASPCPALPAPHGRLIVAPPPGAGARRREVHVLPVSKIAFAQAQDDYVCFPCEGKDYLKEQTLGEVESSLDPARFVRVHRSYLLNLDFLARMDVDERENRIAVLTDGRTPAGQPRRLRTTIGAALARWLVGSSARRLVGSSCSLEPRAMSRGDEEEGASLRAHELSERCRCA